MTFGVDRLFGVTYDHLGRQSSAFEGVKIYFAGSSAAARLLR